MRRFSPRAVKGVRRLGSRERAVCHRCHRGIEPGAWVRCAPGRVAVKHAYDCPAPEPLRLPTGWSSKYGYD